MAHLLLGPLDGANIYLALAPSNGPQGDVFSFTGYRKRNYYRKIVCI